MTLAVNIAQGASNNVTFRNRIINGACVIDQRNAGASVTPTSGTYTLDRWVAYLSQTNKLTIQQNAGSVTPPAGFTNYLGVTSSSAYSVVSSDEFNINQPIEGFNVADLAWGTANAKTVTLSFWVRSSLTGTFGGCLRNGSVARSYPFSYTISAANTWEYKTITVAGDTTGTWATNNTTGLFVTIGLGNGASTSNTAGAWAAGNFTNATGATSVVGTNGATFYLTGVQLEAGTTASPFEYRPYTTELQLCQRYLPAVLNITAGQTFAVGMCISTTAGYGFIPLPVTARVPPTGVTFTGGNTAVYNSSGTAISLGSIGFSTATTQTATLSFGGSGLSAGNATFMLCYNTTTGFYLTGCEL
jgi:hypothetical protein